MLYHLVFDLIIILSEIFVKPQFMLIRWSLLHEMGILSLKINDVQERRL